MSSFNPYTKSIETKLYFIVFTLFSAFLASLIYKSSIDTSITSDVISADQAGIFKPYTGFAQDAPSQASSSQNQ